MKRLKNATQLLLAVLAIASTSHAFAGPIVYNFSGDTTSLNTRLIQSFNGAPPESNISMVGGVGVGSLLFGSLSISDLRPSTVRTTNNGADTTFSFGETFGRTDPDPLNDAYSTWTLGNTSRDSRDLFVGSNTFRSMSISFSDTDDLDSIVLRVGRSRSVDGRFEEYRMSIFLTDPTGTVFDRLGSPGEDRSAALEILLNLNLSDFPESTGSFFHATEGRIRLSSTTGSFALTSFGQPGQVLEPSQAALFFASTLLLGLRRRNPPKALESRDWSAHPHPARL